MVKASDLWMEFLGGTIPCPNSHCGLCGNHGIVDTIGKVTTPSGHPCGVRTFCICPNGRVSLTVPWTRGPCCTTTLPSL